MITGGHHVAFIVSSEDCIRFYEKLGFSVIFKMNRSYDTVILMEGYGIQIEAFIDPNHPAKGEIEPLGIRHIALKVDNIEKTVEELKLDFGAISSDWVGVRYCNIADPDGNVIELHE